MNKRGEEANFVCLVEMAGKTHEIEGNIKNDLIFTETFSLPFSPLKLHLNIYSDDDDDDDAAARGEDER
jgi:hypothetical protein